MMTDLLRLLPKMLRQVGNSEEVRQQAVFAAWVAAVGSQVRQVTTPVRLEKKTLIVAVQSATWRTQLARMSGQALFKINSILGTPTITAIDFVVNPDLIATAETVTREVTFKAPELQALPLRAKAQEIPDPEIRDAFLRAAGKCLERRAK
jgi:hypothetical protein